MKKREESECEWVRLFKRGREVLNKVMRTEILFSSCCWHTPYYVWDTSKGRKKINKKKSNCSVYMYRVWWLCYELMCIGACVWWMWMCKYEWRVELNWNEWAGSERKESGITLCACIVCVCEWVCALFHFSTLWNEQTSMPRCPSKKKIKKNRTTFRCHSPCSLSQTHAHTLTQHFFLFVWYRGGKRVLSLSHCRGCTPPLEIPFSLVGSPPRCTLFRNMTPSLFSYDPTWRIVILHYYPPYPRQWWIHQSINVLITDDLIYLFCLFFLLPSFPSSLSSVRPQNPTLLFVVLLHGHHALYLFPSSSSFSPSPWPFVQQKNNACIHLSFFLFLSLSILIHVTFLPITITAFHIDGKRRGIICLVLVSYTQQQQIMPIPKSESCCLHINLLSVHVVSLWKSVKYCPNRKWLHRERGWAPISGPAQRQIQKQKKWDRRMVWMDGGTWNVVGHRVWFVRSAHFFFFTFTLCVWMCGCVLWCRLEEREGRRKR